MSDDDNLKKARTALRHAAHVYAHTDKQDSVRWTVAADALDNAAVTLTLCAAVCGVRMKPPETT